jgi:hypothetical protein
MASKEKVFDTWWTEKSTPETRKALCNKIPELLDAAGAEQMAAYSIKILKRARRVYGALVEKFHEKPASAPEDPKQKGRGVSSIRKVAGWWDARTTASSERDSFAREAGVSEEVRGKTQRPNFWNLPEKTRHALRDLWIAAG